MGETSQIRIGILQRKFDWFSGSLTFFDPIYWHGEKGCITLYGTIVLRYVSLLRYKEPEEEIVGNLIKCITQSQVLQKFPKNCLQTKHNIQSLVSNGTVRSYLVMLFFQVTWVTLKKYNYKKNFHSFQKWSKNAKQLKSNSLLHRKNK